MSQEFSVVFAGPIVDFEHVLGGISTNLQPLGFRHTSSVTCFEPDESIASGNAEDVTLSYEAFEAGDAADWNGCCTSFSTTDFTLDVSVSRWHTGFLNVYVDANANAMRRGYRDGTLRIYLTALVEIARACQAVGGVGAFGFTPDPISPKEIVNAIIHNPENSGFPADIGLMRSADMPRNVVERFASDTFRIIEIASYWLLVSHEFLQLLRDLEGETAWSMNGWLFAS